MAKGFNSRGVGDFGGGMNMNIMKQVQKMQQDVMRMQQELGTRTYTAVAGGSVVPATATSKRELKEVAIDPGAVGPGDVEMLQDMTVVVVSEALRAAESDSTSTMQQLIGGFGLPFRVEHRGTGQRPAPETVDKPSCRRIWRGEVM